MSDTGTPVVHSIDQMASAIGKVMELMASDPEFYQELSEGRPSGNPITLGPRLPTAEEWTRLQIKGSQDNAAKWLERTTHPKKNFREEALKATSVERFHNSMERVLAEKRWEGGMALVDESETLATIARRGAAAYSKGVSDREPKIRRRVAELRESRLALCAIIDAMSVATDSERETKMIENKRGLQAIGRARRGG